MPWPTLAGRATHALQERICLEVYNKSHHLRISRNGSTAVGYGPENLNVSKGPGCPTPVMGPYETP